MAVTPSQALLLLTAAVIAYKHDRSSLESLPAPSDKEGDKATAKRLAARQAVEQAAINEQRYAEMVVQSLRRVGAFDQGLASLYRFLAALSEDYFRQQDDGPNHCWKTGTAEDSQAASAHATIADDDDWYALSRRCIGSGRGRS